jgi:hypothetical protein
VCKSHHSIKIVQLFRSWGKNLLKASESWGKELVMASVRYAIRTEVYSNEMKHIVNAIQLVSIFVFGMSSWGSMENILRKNPNVINK